MVFLGVSILAGIFTVLAPCILLLLPVVVSASETNSRNISKRALVVIGSLSISIIVFTFLLKASTLLIDIPQTFWSVFSGVIIILVGIAIVYPSFWVKVPYVNKISLISNKAVGTGYQKKSYMGDMLIGLALGPVFTTCSPTYLFIIATALPATFIAGFIYLLGYTIGLAISLLLIAYFGQQIVNKIAEYMQIAGKLKQIFGVLIILVGVAVLTGYDKKIESFILDSGYGATIQLENSLIDHFAPQSNSVKESSTISKSYEIITLAGGCFWCTEAYFQEEEGVVSAVSGYAGGDVASASYLTVAKGTTKHREAVQITYDPNIIYTEKILDIYWSHIDPTKTNG